MASYCGSNDCLLICAHWTNMAGTGTDASAIIAEASAMTDAYLGDFSLSPPQPLTTGGTVYDYFIRRSTAQLAVWLAAESLYRNQYEAGVPAWWDSYQGSALATFEGLRSGAHTLSNSTAVWERGIGPAVPTANGTITAPPMNGLRSNSEVVGDFYLDDTFPRGYIVELDGTGTDCFDQTYRWMYSGGSAWEEEDVELRPMEWQTLSYGVMITADPAQMGTALATGKRWTINATPSRQRNYKGRGLVTRSRKRG